MDGSFEQVLDVQKKNITTSLTVFVSLFAAGLLLLLTKHGIGWFFLALSAGAGVLLYIKNKRLNDELAKAGGAEALAAQYREDGTLRSERFALTLTKDYAVVERPVVYVYPFRDMQKFEVGLAGDVRKALFLTDRGGERHKIAETQKGDGSQEEFDRVYMRVRDHFNNREQ